MSTAASNADSSRLLTAYDLAECRENCRFELIDGQLHRKPYRGFQDGLLCAEIGHVVGDWVKSRGLGKVVSSTGFVLGRDPDTVLSPAIGFLVSERFERQRGCDEYVDGPPNLAIEVVSCGEINSEVDDKARRWLAAGCEMVWVIYPRGRSVTVYKSLNDVRILTGDAALDGGELLPGFSYPLAKLFAGLDSK